MPNPIVMIVGHSHTFLIFFEFFNNSLFFSHHFGRHHGRHTPIHPTSLWHVSNTSLSMSKPMWERSTNSHSSLFDIHFSLFSSFLTIFVVCMSCTHNIFSFLTWPVYSPFYSALEHAISMHPFVLFIAWQFFAFISTRRAIESTRTTALDLAIFPTSSMHASCMYASLSLISRSNRSFSPTPSIFWMNDDEFIFGWIFSNFS